MIQKIREYKYIIFGVGSFGLLFIGLLLFTGHPGIAIKITNYLFFVMFIIILYEKFYKK